MKQLSFSLSEDYIELIKLLKLLGIAEHGADAKNLVEQNAVYCNGVLETRKRYKVRRGDTVTCRGTEITIR